MTGPSSRDSLRTGQVKTAVKIFHGSSPLIALWTQGLSVDFLDLESRPRRKSWTRIPWQESRPHDDRHRLMFETDLSKKIQESAFSGDALMVSHVSGPRPFMYLLEARRK